MCVYGALAADGQQWRRCRAQGDPSRGFLSPSGGEQGQGLRRESGGRSLYGLPGSGRDDWDGDACEPQGSGTVGERVGGGPGGSLQCRVESTFGVNRSTAESTLVDSAGRK